MTSCNQGEMSARCWRGGAGVIHRRCLMPLRVPGAPKGSSPVASSYSMTPMAKMSLRGSPRTPTTSSRPLPPPPPPPARALRGRDPRGGADGLAHLLGQQVGVMRVAREAEIEQHGAAVIPDEHVGGLQIQVAYV